jgi:environmental stress-induced protein Ves
VARRRALARRADPLTRRVADARETVAVPIQRFADHRVMPWPNGRGTSYEIACDTPGRPGWTWRVAIAPVVDEGPFSHFEGVHRRMIVFEGGTMVLDVGGETLACPLGVVVEFPGDVPTTATLPDGPIVDLNLMTLRGRTDGSMRHATAPGPLGACDVVMVTSPTATIVVDGVAHALARRDAVVDARAHALALSDGSAAVMSITRA